MGKNETSILFELKFLWLQPSHRSIENSEVKQARNLFYTVMNLIYFRWMNCKGLFAGLVKTHYL